MRHGSCEAQEQVGGGAVKKPLKMHFLPGLHFCGPHVVVFWVFLTPRKGPDLSPPAASRPGVALSLTCPCTLSLSVSVPPPPANLCSPKNDPCGRPLPLRGHLQPCAATFLAPRLPLCPSTPRR